MCVCMLIGGRW